MTCAGRFRLKRQGRAEGDKGDVLTFSRTGSRTRTVTIGLPPLDDPGPLIVDITCVLRTFTSRGVPKDRDIATVFRRPFLFQRCDQPDCGLPMLGNIAPRLFPATATSR